MVTFDGTTFPLDFLGPMLDTFTYFPQLPPELRRMIWEFCIPRRVVELQLPVKDVLGKIDGDFSWTNKRISAPPVITQVCRESRQVGLANGGPLKKYSEAVEINFNWKATDAWFSPKYDIVAWYWRAEQQADYELEVIGDPMSYFVHHALQAQGALILAQHIYPFLHFEPSPHGPPPLEEVDLTQLSRLKSIMVCVSIVEIQEEPEGAELSNLWGRTGEDMIQIVDVTDADTMRRFSDPTGTGDAQREKFFGRYRDEDYPKEFERWRRELTTWWIWQHWMVAFEKGFKDVPDPENIFIDKLANFGPVALPLNKLHPTTFWAPEYFPYTFDMENFVENRDHPWVAQILNTMPDFRPVVMFRLVIWD